MKTGILDGRSGYPEREAHVASAPACPRCNGKVNKIHRRWPDRLLSVLYSVRRYRCRSEACGWQGLRGAPRPSSSRWADAALVPLGWIIAGVLALLLLAALWLAFMDYERVSPPQSNAEVRQPAPVLEEAGDSIPGTPLDADDPRRLAGGAVLEARRGCVWGGPGQHPYTGNLTAALTAAQLPSDVVGKLAIMRDGGVISDRLEVSSAGIRSADHQRDYGYKVKAMTYDAAICFDSKVNLPSKAVGAANLYELVDARQQRYSVMVVADGGNVAVLETPVGR